MPRLVAFDAGPLAALFIPDDPYHQRAVAFVAKLRTTAFTTIPVVTEVMYLLDFSVPNQLRFLEWLRRGTIQIENLSANDWERSAALLAKYADLPADFADVSLIVTCEKRETRLIATVDSDFGIYRYKDRLTFTNLFSE